jgi:hypothetical protein
VRVSLSDAERARRERNAWRPPAALLEAAQAATWRGDPAGEGDHQLPVGQGTTDLGRELRRLFPVVWSVGTRSGYPVSSGFSMHHAGRALDLMVRPLADGTPDPRGDEVADYLLEHARTLGVQFLIWRGTDWASSTGRTALYTGRRDHFDHIHVDLTRAASRVVAPVPRNDDSSGGELLLLLAALWGLSRLK